MRAFLIVGLVMLLGWAALERGLERFRLTGPLLMVGTGALVGLFVADELNAHLNTAEAEKVVELILALLLFVDATEVRGGPFGGEMRVVSRLLFFALPLSLLAAVATGTLLMPELSWPVLVILACIVIPTDFAPASAILRARGVPAKIRHILNVESGYNDGIVAPIFVFALVLVGARVDFTPLGALEEALPSFAVAAATGVVVGGIAGAVLQRTIRVDLSSPHSARLAMVLVPILTYLLATSFEANGFVAAFIAGIAYHASRAGSAHADLDHAETVFADDLGQLVAMAMWFAFGALAVLVFSNGFDPVLVLFGVIAALVLRLVPVVLALLGSSLSWRERFVVGMVGPRGTASIVFGLLAFNALPQGVDLPPLYAMTIVVAASILFHGMIAPTLAKRLLHQPPSTGRRRSEPQVG